MCARIKQICQSVNRKNKENERDRGQREREREREVINALDMQI